MRRVVAVIATLIAAAAMVAATVGASGGGSVTRYKVVIDNAFGLTEGADLKVAGVRAGKIEKLDVQRSSARALVTIGLDSTKFGALHSDAFCEIRPQSLIGEYFMDCNPGTGARLAAGSTIPVSQTASTVAVDIVNNTLREPYNVRFGLILSELGAGLAARGEDLNETIRRAVPALRETNRVLKILADNRRVLNSLTREADQVMVKLADNRKDVSRFVVEAGKAAQASADRRDALAASIKRFPPFLEGLRPTLADLGTAADRQVPALADLRASAGRLTTFFNRLGPFSTAATPALKTLGDASDKGRAAVAPARATVAQLRTLAGPTREVGKNLALVLEDLDNRDRAVEPDPDSPGGQGYTGLEALLQYPLDQSLAANIFDRRGYLLKLNALANDCGSYTNAERARSDPARYEKCKGGLGPNQIGITAPDPTAGARTDAGQRRGVGRNQGVRRSPSSPAPLSSPRSGGDTPAVPGPGTGDRPGSDRLPPLPLPELPSLPSLPPLPDLPDLPGRDAPLTPLLDFLLGP